MTTISKQQALLELSVADLVRHYPAASELLAANGCGVIVEPENLGIYGNIVKLRTLFSSQQVDPEQFFRQLEDVKVLTSCPSCLQGLARYQPDTGLKADYIVVELARRMLGGNWQEDYLARADAGSIERVLL